MLDIKKVKEGSNMTLTLKGRLDTITAPNLEDEIDESIDDVTDLVMDFQEIEYVSSAGLRVLLTAQQTMDEKGSMVIKNASDSVKDVFEITGFVDILNVE